ncbi:hypothetical protein EDD15DRAFT_2362583 [Pisolithus albus]|nr:hypothetical protein EDD15DRAFT_2362583 [Pisolithus albus]
MKSNLSLPPIPRLDANTDMSQYAANTGLPPASAILDWTAVPDEAIQSASDDDQQVADAKFAECQRRKRLQREQKAAAAECREREEAERREHEETEHQEREEAVHQEREPAERVQGYERQGEGNGTRPSGDPGGTLQPVLTGPGPVHLQEQCKLLGVAKEGKEGKRVPEDQTSPRASEKKKRTVKFVKGRWGELPERSPIGNEWGGYSPYSARARSPKVEVVGGPSKVPEAESGGGGLVEALHGIAEAIDQHTEEMQEHRRLVKSQHETQRRFNNHLWELLQETEYQQVETDESEGDDTSEGELEDSKSSDDGWEDDVREEGTDAKVEV